MSFNAKELGYNVCPRCKGSELNAGAFSISPDCYLSCVSCGFGIEEEVSWEGCRSVREHDRMCMERLKEVWNNLED